MQSFNVTEVRDFFNFCAPVLCTVVTDSLVVNIYLRLHYVRARIRSYTFTLEVQHVSQPLGLARRPKQTELPDAVTLRNSRDF